jgi:presenilin-like A22 family membrane protease
MQPEDPPFAPIELDPTFEQQVQKLYLLIAYSRWIVVGCLWLTVGVLSLWGLRAEIALLLQYFTWVAVRYGLYYNPLPTFGLAFCLVMTISTIIWQSRILLFGLPPKELRRLAKQVQQIRQQGTSHPLWKWICQ